MKKMMKPPKIDVYHKEQRFGAIVSAIFVIILIFIMMFYIDSVRKPEREKLSAVNFNFANYIDEDYNYEANPTSTFTAGDDVYVYFEVVNYQTIKKDGGLEAALTSDIQVLDPAKELVPQLSRKGIFDEVFESPAGPIPVKTQFNVPEYYPKGEYTFIQTVYDKYTGNAVRLSKEFSIE